MKGLVQPPDPAFNLDASLQNLLPGNLGKLPLVSVDGMNKIYQSRAEALLAVDEMIGNLLDQIEAMKVQDKTFVFFSW